MSNRIIFLLILILPYHSFSQGITYPYPVKSITITLDNTDNKMSFMDVKAQHPNGETILLFHGKNFTALYWKNVISFLVNAGYRVIAPDQIGWGLSSKPDIRYSFEMLAGNNRQLLDSLDISTATIVGHSMGGMLAARFALMFPERTRRLVLEDPLGLEDYKTFIPYQSIDKVYNKELNGSYAAYEKYHKTYYPVWKPSYELYVKAQAEALKQKDFNSVAYTNALTYQMIYEQPVLAELDKIKLPTLIIVGESDRTIPGKSLLSSTEQSRHGNFPLLARKAQSRIIGSKVVILKGVGHIPHIQIPELFNKTLLQFLKAD